MKITPKQRAIFDAHLSANWLRPENVVWDSTASLWLRTHAFVPPILDIGCGNGFFTFLTAGGQLDLSFDWFINTHIRPSQSRGDIYDTRRKQTAFKIVRAPDYRVAYGMDYKPNLLQQAALLKTHDQLLVCDANRRLPLPDESASTIFSNIFYWLKSPSHILSEAARLLRRGGRGYFCIPSTHFFSLADSYGRKSEWQRLLNGTRREAIQWTASPVQFNALTKKAGLRLLDVRPYLKPRTLAYWDLGMRPILHPLIRMANSLNPAVRKSIKKEWINYARPYLLALLQEEFNAPVAKAGFHLFTVEKL